MISMAAFLMQQSLGGSGMSKYVEFLPIKITETETNDEYIYEISSIGVKISKNSDSRISIVDVLWKLLANTQKALLELIIRQDEEL